MDFGSAKDVRGRPSSLSNMTGSATAPATDNEQIENNDVSAVGQSAGVETADIQTVVYAIQTNEAETQSTLVVSALETKEAPDEANPLALQQMGNRSDETREKQSTLAVASPKKPAALKTNEAPANPLALHQTGNGSDETRETQSTLVVEAPRKPSALETNEDAANPLADGANPLVLQQMRNRSDETQLCDTVSMELPVVATTPIDVQSDSVESSPKLKRKCLLDTPQDPPKRQQRRCARTCVAAARKSKSDTDLIKASLRVPVKRPKKAPKKKTFTGTCGWPCQFHMIEQQDEGRVFTSRVLDTPDPTPQESYHCPVCLHNQGLVRRNRLVSKEYEPHF